MIVNERVKYTNLVMGLLSVQLPIETSVNWTAIEVSIVIVVNVLNFGDLRHFSPRCDSE